MLHVCLETPQAFCRVVPLVLVDVYLDHVELVAAGDSKAYMTVTICLLGKAVVAAKLLLQVAAREPSACLLLCVDDNAIIISTHYSKAILTNNDQAKSHPLIHLPHAR